MAGGKAAVASPESLIRTGRVIARAKTLQTLKAFGPEFEAVNYDGSEWEYIAGDWSGLVSRDQYSGIIAEVNGVSATAGARLRKFGGAASSKWFQIVADGNYQARTGTDNTAKAQAFVNTLSYLGLKGLWAPGQYMVNGLKLDGVASGYPNYGRIMLEGCGIPGSSSATDSEGVVLFSQHAYTGRVVECVGDWYTNTARCVYLKNFRIEAGSNAESALYLEQITENFRVENVIIRTTGPYTNGMSLISCWTGTLDLVRMDGLSPGNEAVGLLVDSDASNPDHFQVNQITMRSVEVRDFKDNERYGGLTLNSSNPIGPIARIGCQASHAERYNQVFASGVRGIAHTACQNENSVLHGAVLLNDCHGVTWDETSWFNNNGIETASQNWNILIASGPIPGASLAVSHVRIAAQFFNCRNGIRVVGNYSGGKHLVNDIDIDSPRMTPHATESLVGVSIDATDYDELPDWRYKRGIFTADFDSKNLADAANNLTWQRGTKRQRFRDADITGGTITIDEMVTIARLEFTIGAIVTTIEGGIVGQSVMLYPANGNVTINQSGNIRLKNSPFIMGAADSVRLTKWPDGTWREETGS